jgi:hypothetical protein
MQAILAQCQAEGAASVGEYLPGGQGPVPWIAGVATRSDKQTTMVNGCMGRNGYISQ